MRIICQASYHFVLQLFDGSVAGELYYETDPSAGVIKTAQEMQVEHTGVGSWRTSVDENGKRKTIAEIKIRPGGIIALYNRMTKKKYSLRIAGIYKNRFVLFNNRQEEILSLLPVINWDGKGHEYMIQPNEEFSSECSPLLVLHAIHCANCYLGILNGVLPALINI